MAKIPYLEFNVTFNFYKEKCSCARNLYSTSRKLFSIIYCKCIKTYNKFGTRFYLSIRFWRFGPPICTVLIWVSLFALWLKVAPHISHVFGLRPKWTPFTCSSNFSFDINPFGHRVHLHGFLSSGVCRLKIWNWRFFLDEQT